MIISQAIYTRIEDEAPPLDVKVIVKREVFRFDDMALIASYSSEKWSDETLQDWLVGCGYELWSRV